MQALSAICLCHPHGHETSRTRVASDWNLLRHPRSRRNSPTPTLMRTERIPHHQVQEATNTISYIPHNLQEARWLPESDKLCYDSHLFLLRTAARATAVVLLLIPTALLKRTIVSCTLETAKIWTSHLLITMQTTSPSRGRRAR